MLCGHGMTSILPPSSVDLHGGGVPASLWRIMRYGSVHRVSIYVNTEAVRAAAGRLDSASEILTGANRNSVAAGEFDLGDLTPAVAAASKQVTGVLTVARAAADELGTNVRACAAVYESSDHKSAGIFHGLT